jgi:hypothetical protein
MPLTRFVRAGALLVSLLVTASPSFAAIYYYSAILNPRQETPLVASSALGGGRFIIDTDANTVRYWISFGGLSSPEAAAHIHGFAGAGVNAGIVHALPAGNPKIGVWNYNEVDETAILDGRTYANIHSANFPGGEMRGQIVPFNALLGSSQEAPVNASTGSGWAIATIDPVANMLNYHVFYEGLTGAVVASHFHGNANYGTSVGVKVAIPAVASPIIGSVAYLEADEGAIMSGRWYVNLHTAVNPGGEIRGQLVPRVIPMDALQEVPVNAAMASAGFGLVAIDTAANVLGYDVRVVALSAPENAAHIHGFAQPGNNAGVQMAIAPSPGAQKLGTWAYGAANETDVLLGRSYFNVHTTANPGGEIRGQIMSLPGEGALLGVDGEQPRVISGLAAAPNPSTGEKTRLTFQLSRSGNVSLSIVGVDGRALRSIPAALYAPGTHSYEWDGRDDDGRPVAAGVYFAVARTPDGEKVTRIARIR